ncbi:polysaccharide lyase family 3 protein [Stipitochalara longipes BDJ]|nr:polysaccharide lyase family 3 protein [Stipitochalara longipes BDJ]
MRSSTTAQLSATATSNPATTGGASNSSGGSLPASSGTSALSAAQTIEAGGSFDGGMVMYDRGVSCTGQTEGGESDAVFQIENGGSLSNVIIGPNQIEGVHCQGACTLTNVWWSSVCEDAFSIKNQDTGETTTINGGGAFGASDKVVQHNGAGTVSISGFTVSDFGKLYRSCGNCNCMFERHVIIDGVTASDGSEIAGINSNYGDTATITNLQATNVDDVCVTFEGNDTGDEAAFL